MIPSDLPLRFVCSQHNFDDVSIFVRSLCPPDIVFTETPSCLASLVLDLFSVMFSPLTEAIKVCVSVRFSFATSSVGEFIHMLSFIAVGDSDSVRYDFKTVHLFIGVIGNASFILSSALTFLVTKKPAYQLSLDLLSLRAISASGRVDTVSFPSLGLFLLVFFFL